MSFFEGIMKQVTGAQDNAGGLGGLVDIAMKNPQVLGALAGLLSTRDASIGGSGGLAGLVGAFQQKGLGDLMSGWIAKGPNPGISADQVHDVLGAETLNQFAAKAGVQGSEAGALLSRLLPTAVDQLTPDGKLPETDTLENTLSSLLSKLGSGVDRTPGS